MSSITDDEFRSKIDNHFALYRMNLRSPLIQQVSLDHWYRVEVFLVNEIGLFKRADIEPNGRVYLGCDLLVPSSSSLTPFQRDELYQISLRPSTLASATLPVTDIAGFIGNGKGSFEYKITLKEGQSEHLIKKNDQLGSRYLRIYCTQCDQFPKQLKNPPNNLDDLILPLVVGPIELTKQKNPNQIVPTNTCIENWPSAIPTVHGTYRLFSFRSSNNNNHNNNVDDDDNENNNIAIHESWENGIMAKIWDSALVMFKMLKLMVQKDKTIFDGQRIVDLSAGTGLIGISIIEVAKPSKVTITELDEALNLINYNVQLNKYLTDKCLLNVKSLLWGDDQQMQECGKADIIIASDVLYESEFFEDLVKTFVNLCDTNGKIYIGYKRRGFDRNEEEKFWKLCEHHFFITLLNDPSTTDSDKTVVPPLAFESGVQIYKLTFK